MILRESHQESSPASSTPTATATASRSDERQPLVAQLGARLGDDDRAERLALGLEPHRLGRREVRAAAPGRRELERHRPLQLAHRRRHGRLREPLQAGVLPGKERGADVEDPVARRELELRGGEVDRARSLVGGPQRGVGVELREPGRLALQLLDRLAARVGLEEPQRDQRRDDAGEHDPEQEQGRQAESQRPEHDRSVGLAASLGGRRGGAAILARPCSPRPRR